MNEAAPLKRHFVDREPFDPGLTEPTGAENEGFYRASSWKLMWWKFRRHKVAVASAYILLAFDLIRPFDNPDLTRGIHWLCMFAIHTGIAMQWLVGFMYVRKYAAHYRRNP